MHKIVISDTSTLILFDKIEEFDLLHEVYGELLTTPEIAEEFGEELPCWIKEQEVTEKNTRNFLKRRWTAERQVQ